MTRPWPWPEQNGTREDTETYKDEVIAVFEVLDRWFRALQDGSHVHMGFDPLYKRPNGKPDFTREQVDRIIDVALDEWFENSANVNYARNTRNIVFDGPPAFRRLAFPQRLALAQQLEMALEPVAVKEPVMDPNSGVEVG